MSLLIKVYNPDSSIKYLQHLLGDDDGFHWSLSCRRRGGTFRLPSNTIPWGTPHLLHALQQLHLLVHGPDVVLAPEDPRLQLREQLFP